MPPPRPAGETGQRRDRPKPSRAARFGQPVPRLPFCGRWRRSDASVWLLALCIAVALLLRTAPAAQSQERLQEWLPETRHMPADIEGIAARRVGPMAMPADAEPTTRPTA